MMPLQMFQEKLAWSLFFANLILKTTKSDISIPGGTQQDMIVIGFF
jgi:hypothetical protein